VYRNKLIGIIGAGDIGLNLAEICALQGFDIIIYNRYHEVDGKPSPYWLQKMGRVMDMSDSLQMPSCGSVTLTADIQQLNDAQYIVITAGAKRTSPDETREELARKNATIITSQANFIAHVKNSLTMIVSNPVDGLTQCLIYKVAELSGKKVEEVAKRIIGVSLIDSLRLKNLVRETLCLRNKSYKRSIINAVAIGEHGPTMVPIMSSLTIDDINIDDLLSTEDINHIRQQTILRGNDIIRLTGASSVIGPSHAVMNMILMLTTYPKISIPCAVWDGKRVVGNLVKFVNQRVSTIEQVNIDKHESQLLANSYMTLDKQFRLIYPTAS